MIFSTVILGVAPSGGIGLRLFYAPVGSGEHSSWGGGREQPKASGEAEQGDRAE